MARCVAGVLYLHPKRPHTPAPGAPASYRLSVVNFSDVLYTITITVSEADKAFAPLAHGWSI